ncbi:hypothetical protein MEQU1_002635 [Malassezia equina]|uniref:Uncharacterized protein n=1 Tax=Malassezia equina TaxID=1381935 RepID=A0AAF0EE26_9BASI|nr:hypothetical protein MEQU1_002635 [Malassezia equina]
MVAKSLFARFLESKHDKKDTRRRWSLPLRRHTERPSLDEGQILRDSRRPDLPDIVLQSSTPRQSLNYEMPVVSPALTGPAMHVTEATPTEPANDVAEDKNRGSVPPYEAEASVDSREPKVDEAVQAAQPQPQPHVVLVDPLPIDSVPAPAPSSEASAEPATAVSGMTRLDAPPVEPQGTPAEQEDVDALQQVLKQRCKTIGFLKRAISGEEQYVYSVFFRREDFSAAVPRPSLLAWYANSSKVCEVMEKSIQLTWPHEVLECVEQLVIDLRAVVHAEEPSEAPPMESEHAEPVDIVDKILTLLDALQKLYAKLLLWLDRNALSSLVEEHYRSPVMPSYELLEILGQVDRDLKKFIKCVAKDLSFVARCVCQIEISEWDKILCHRQIDWEDLANQLQLRSERLARTVAPSNDPSCHSSPGLSDVEMLDPAFIENIESAKRHSLMSVFRKKKDTRRQSMPPMDLMGRMRHSLSRHSSLPHSASMATAFPGFSRTSAEPFVPK